MGATVAARGASDTDNVAETPALAIVAGQRVRHYEVIRELGRGGMGVVALARDTRLGRRVALKFLVSESSELTARFLVEARTTALVNHDNIVVIHEVDELDNTPYMVLEYLEGGTLRRLLDGTAMTAGRAVEIAVPIARALVRAHEAGIVHRDLKPENVFVTDAGGIKVLDFGIAKLLERGPQAHVAHAPSESALGNSQSNLTSVGTLVGTLQYMSPEQLGVDEVDHRSDLWALGIMMFEMVTGRHPLPPPASVVAFVAQVADLDEPMPRVGALAPDLPERLDRLIDRCLAKHKAERYASAKELLDELEALLPGRYGRRLGEDESPYPGMTAFQEADADRFFGRDQDVARLVTRVREMPVVAVVGPSGVGKSSFVRAGLVPALKGGGEAWETHVLRPGRQPLASLASLIHTAETNPSAEPGDDAVVTRLAREPGYLGSVLRKRGTRKRTQILIFIDQFEELYTLVPDPAERLAYVACLLAAADDAASPVRVVVSMRSDFLDRTGEDPRFLDELTRGLVFLQPLGAAALHDALVQPLEMRGYRFEASEMLGEMLMTLASTPAALPLLQFAAAKLWEMRDRRTKLLTRAAYDVIGGISGALATHADQVLATLVPAAQVHVRAVFRRLVTPERTRAIVDLRELRELASDPQTIDQVIDRLAAARLLVVQSVGESGVASVEIVHESLITTWPALRHWLDEGQEDAAQLAQLRDAANQWDRKGRSQGLLWRGEAVVEARRWSARYRGELAERDRAFLDAVLSLGTRAARMRRAIVIGVIALLSLAVAGGTVALLSIREAEHVAVREAANASMAQQRAEVERARAQTETDKWKDAERVSQQRYEQLVKAQAAQVAAQNDAAEKGAVVEMTQAELKDALAKAEHERALAMTATIAATKAREGAERLYLQEKARADAMEKQRAKITTELRK